MERIPNLTGRYLKVPLQYEADGFLKRSLDEEVRLLDNLIELIVFTPRGSFTSDPDFGFEYWNYEFANVHLLDFNNGHSASFEEGNASVITKKACIDSLTESLSIYGSCLKNVDVTMTLKSPEKPFSRGRKAFSKYEVVVTVRGTLDNGLETESKYEKSVQFLVEPIAKKKQI